MSNSISEKKEKKKKNVEKSEMIFLFFICFVFFSGFSQKKEKGICIKGDLEMEFGSIDTLAEWLRRRTANAFPLWSEGSNPSGVEFFFFTFFPLFITFSFLFMD